MALSGGWKKAWVDVRVEVGQEPPQYLLVRRQVRECLVPSHSSRERSLLHQLVSLQTKTCAVEPSPPPQPRLILPIAISRTLPLLAKTPHPVLLLLPPLVNVYKRLVAPARIPSPSLPRPHRSLAAADHTPRLQRSPAELTG
jgi:hypothetical protein